MSAAPSRRAVVGGLAAFGVTGARAQSAARVVVIGGGFGGATCARTLKRIDPGLAVTLIEANRQYVSCPYSNEVIAGLRDLQAQTFGYDRVAADGVEMLFTSATTVDTTNRIVTVADGSRVPYDRLVVSPGVDLAFDALPGYDEAASTRMPHAWKAGAQTTLLRDQIEAMRDGGLVVISVPANPYRCPPGPYERASLIAHVLKTRKPKSKVLVLDAKDVFSKQKLFQSAWAALYPGLLEWVPLSAGGATTAVDAAAMTVSTDFETHKADVACIIPPQRAGRIAVLAGLTDRTGWCPVHPESFESRLQPGVHVIGDAAVLGAVPKSAFAANAEAKVCAMAIVRLLRGLDPGQPRLVNTCYSLVAPGYGISVAGVYHPAGALFADVEGAGGTSPLAASLEFRAGEAAQGESWFGAITTEVFG